MQPSDVFARAEARARGLQTDAPPGEDVRDRLRSECVAFFGKVPEPPVYRRADDPLRRRANELLPEAELLLARLTALALPELDPLLAAVKAAVEALCHTVDGRVEAAEEAFRRGLSLEKEALSARRLWARSDEVMPPVFDRLSGVSRFDPRPDPSLKVKLACPACRQVAAYAFSPHQARTPCGCDQCGQPFSAYLGEARGVEVQSARAGLRRYLFRIEELNGGLTRLAVEDEGQPELSVAPRDLLAFLYSRTDQLRGVLNLSTGRLLWIKAPGPCFIATAAFGEGAPELESFRAFRDQVLLPRPWGRALTRAYYRVGPWAAAALRRRRRTKALVRRALLRVHQHLEDAGF